VKINSIKTRFLNLPTSQKLVGVGALLALVSAVLPWYQDFDTFNTGVQFLGITGPLYLVGFIIIGFSLFTLILTGFYLFDKKIPDLPMKESLIYILSGATSLFLLLIANSVYFHREFGTNITSKEYGIGMMIALAGALAITIGGIMQSRESGTKRYLNKFEEETRIFEEEEKVDPVVELNNFQKEQQEIAERQQRTEEIKKTEEPPEPAPEPKKSTAQERFEGHKGVREYKAKSDISGKPTKVRQEPYPDPALLKKEAKAQASPSTDSKEGVNPNTVIRMDL